MYQNPSIGEATDVRFQVITHRFFLCRAYSRIDRRRSRAVGGQDGKTAAGGGWSNKSLGDSIRENLAGYLGRNRDAYFDACDGELAYETVQRGDKTDRCV